MPELADSAQYTSMDLKDRGNQWFSEKKYDQALACYSDAIVSPVDTKYQASINSVCIEQHEHGDEGIPHYSLVQRGKPWEIWSHVVMSGRQREDTGGVTDSNNSCFMLKLPCACERRMVLTLSC